MQRQYRDYGDSRNKGFCVHCGGAYETDDHNPSKVFLDEPLPPNLPLAQSCLACNNGFSADEEYVSCLIDCAITGTADPEAVRRDKVRRALSNNRRLRNDLQAARSDIDGRIEWQADMARVNRIVVKMARGLTAFELNEPQLDPPDRIDVRPFVLLSPEARETFERGESEDFALWPEVGSRALNRLIIGKDDEYVDGWLVVQPGRFRYRTDQDDGVTVRMDIGGYLACTVAWV